MGYKIREVIEREISAPDFRTKLDVCPVRPPLHAIGDIVTTCVNDGNDIEAGIVKSLAWHNKYESYHYSYVVTAFKGQDPAKIESREFHEDCVMVLDRIVFREPTQQPD